MNSGTVLGSVARAQPTRVAAAVIRRTDGAVLLSLRPARAAHGGLWEFPGGKLEAREREVDGLARELEEELGITIARATPVIRVVHQYPDKLVELSVLEVSEWQGEPHGREGQEIRWVHCHELAAFDFPAANVPVTLALKLPRIALIAPASLVRQPDFGDYLEQCLAAGVRLVRLGLQDIAEPLRLRLGRDAVARCEAHAASLLLDGAIGDALAIGAHGLHLDAQRLLQQNQRPLTTDFMLSATCHNRTELQHAQTMGVDFVYLSPVHGARRQENRAVLGWHGLRQLVRQTRVPVYASGGLCPGDTRMALRAGCQGIAMMSAMRDCVQPEAAVREALAAVASAAYVVAER